VCIHLTSISKVYILYFFYILVYIVMLLFEPGVTTLHSITTRKILNIR